MRNYLGAKFGDEEDYSYGNTDKYDYKPGIIGTNTYYDASTPQAAQAIQGESTAPASTAVSGASLIGPAASVGGSFLVNYLAAKAAEERQRRDLAMRTQADYAQNQNKGMDTLLNAWTRSLR